MQRQEFRSTSPEATRAFAREFGAALEPGTVIALHGDLGAGKTCFTQGMAEGLGVTGPVQSPTYTLASEYQGRLHLVHIDLYRIHGPNDAYSVGIEDYLEPVGVTVLEWAERISPILPAHTIHIRLEHGESDDVRHIRIEGSRP